MATRRRRQILVGRAPILAPERSLLRAFQPMIREVQASIGDVRTVGHARALGRALRARWPDSRIRGLLLAAGRPMETAGSRPWLPLARRVESPTRRRARDSARLDAARRPYDGEKLVESWSREASSLISSVRSEVAEGLRREVVSALGAGTDPATLAERWRRRGIPVEFGTLEGRVRVIAQHQLAVLNARVQKERANALGVREFFWRTQGDDRVREAHEELADTKHAYDRPPSEGLPGEPVNCRCWAESVIPAKLAGELGLSSVFER